MIDFPWAHDPIALDRALKLGAALDLATLLVYVVVTLRWRKHGQP